MNQGGIIGIDIIKRLGLTYLPTCKSFNFNEHIAVDKTQQFAAQTIFKNTAEVVAEMEIDCQMCIPPHCQRMVHLNCLPKHQGATAVANIYSSQFPLLWGVLQ